MKLGPQNRYGDSRVNECSKLAMNTTGWIACAGVFGGAAVRADPPPGYGFEWVTIGAPGNRPTIPGEVPALPTLKVGSVDYEYGIMRTHVTNAQYLEFANAYAPFWQGTPGDITLTGYWGKGVQGPGGWSYVPRPGSENFPARIEWEMAARYCNWLTNDKRLEAWAFETGAYDLTLSWPDNLQHLPTARVRMPTLDEYDKAVYYDSDRYGPGLEGYWQYPDGGDEPLVMGLPEDGGETIGDLLWQTDPGRGLGGFDIGQYPDVQSPWGLIDVSAMVQDFTETLFGMPTQRLVRSGGSLAGDAPYELWDRLDLDMVVGFDSGWGGLRLVTSVPTPGGGTVVLLYLASIRQRRTKCASICVF